MSGDLLILCNWPSCLHFESVDFKQVRSSALILIPFTKLLTIRPKHSPSIVLLPALVRCFNSLSVESRTSDFQAYSQIKVRGGTSERKKIHGETSTLSSLSRPVSPAGSVPRKSSLVLNRKKQGSLRQAGRQINAS